MLFPASGFNVTIEGVFLFHQNFTAIVPKFRTFLIHINSLISQQSLNSFLRKKFSPVLIQGAPGSLNSSSAYIGNASVPSTGVVSQRYARATVQKGMFIERDRSLADTLPSGS